MQSKFTKFIMYRYLLINDAEIRVEKYEIKKEEKDDPDD